METTTKSIRNSKGVESICPICKKRFYQPLPESWVYKHRGKQGKMIKTCSYSCNTKAMNEYNKGRKRKRNEESKNYL